MSVIVDVSTPDSFAFVRRKADDPRLVAIPLLLVTGDELEQLASRHVLSTLDTRRVRH